MYSQQLYLIRERTPAEYLATCIVNASSKSVKTKYDIPFDVQRSALKGIRKCTAKKLIKDDCLTVKASATANLAKYYKIACPLSQGQAISLRKMQAIAALYSECPNNLSNLLGGKAGKAWVKQILASIKNLQDLPLKKNNANHHSLYKYTYSDYQNINNYLYNPKSVIPEYKVGSKYNADKYIASIKNHITNIDNEFNTTQHKHNGGTLYRINQPHKRKYIVGKIYTRKGYLSTFGSKSNSKHIFADGSSLAYHKNRSHDFFHYTVPKNHPVLKLRHISSSPDENEHLLPRGTKYRVDKIVSKPLKNGHVVNHIHATILPHKTPKAIAKIFASTHDGDAYFKQPYELESEFHNPKSRETLIHISPSDYLLMIDTKYHNPEKLANVRKLVKEGIKFKSIPYLGFVHDGKGVAQVGGQEGRHRAMVLKELGVKSMPCSFLSKAGGGGREIRWGSCQDPKSFDYVPIMPRILCSEVHKVIKIPFPQSDIYPQKITTSAHVISTHDYFHEFARDEKFEENKHPRLKDGEFAPKNGGKSNTPTKPKSVRDNHENTIVKDGKRLRENGEPLPDWAEKLKIPPKWEAVTIAKDPNASLLVIGKDSKGRPTSIYSLAHQEKAAAVKFVRIKDLDRNFKTIYKENEDARQSDNPRKRDAADCTFLIMKMGLRPGSDADTQAKEKAYGASNMLGKHVVIDGDKVNLKFTGKKGVKIDLPVTNKDVAKMLRERKEKAGDDGKLFSHINEEHLLHHVSSLGGAKGGFKTKDFRTLLATKTATKLVMEDKNPPKNEKEYKRKVMEVAKHCSSLLGNQPVVCLQSYLNPSCFAPWKIDNEK